MLGPQLVRWLSTPSPQYTHHPPSPNAAKKQVGSVKAVVKPCTACIVPKAKPARPPRVGVVGVTKSTATFKVGVVQAAGA